MKLIFGLSAAFFQLSNGLRIDATPRTLQCRVADTFHQTSRHLSSASRQIASVAVMGALIAISPLSDISPANAANLEASQLFAKAESAIEANLRDFKGLDQDWSNSKKVIAENVNLLSKASGSLGTLTTKMKEYSTAVTKMVDDDLLATTGIQTEIAALRESTGEKYAAAETASAIPAKPAVTAQLFLKAQNEAAILAQDEKTQKSFVDVVVVDSTLKKRADEVLAVLLGSVEKSSEIQAIQAAGLLEMTEGLASNAKACKDSLNECNESGAAGIASFRNGVKTVESADEKFSKLKRDVTASLRSLETIDVDVTKSIEKLNEIILDNTNFEETTKLRLKIGKSTVKTIGQKYENLLKLTASIMERTSGANELLANKNVNSKKDITDSLKLASTQLDVADKSGKAAEKLLKQAKAQGDKESAKYLKFVPPPPLPPAAPAAPVTASIPSAPSAK